MKLSVGLVTKSEYPMIVLSICLADNISALLYSMCGSVSLPIEYDYLDPRKSRYHVLVRLQCHLVTKLEASLVTYVRRYQRMAKERCCLGLDSRNKDVTARGVATGYLIFKFKGCLESSYK